MTGTEFHALRLALRMTQASLGKQLDRHRNTIGNFESGKQAIPLSIARLLSFLLEERSRHDATV